MKVIAKPKTEYALTLAAGLYVVSLCAYAEETQQAHQVKLKISTTLSAAADAASSAANAANAAAIAASAAANAASAAVDAINSILSPSQRIPPKSTAATKPSKNALAASPAELGNAGTSNTPSAIPATSGQPETNRSPSVASSPTPMPGSEPAPRDTRATLPNSDLAQRFATPGEHNLIGLVGNYEIVVAADARGEFATGVAGIQGEGAEPVQAISAINLAQAVQASLGFSREVLAASARLDQAAAQTGQARAFLLPSLLLNLKSGREISSPGSQIDATTGHEVAQSNHTRSDRSLTLKQALLDVPGFLDWRRRKVVEQSRMEGRHASEGDTYLATVNAYLALASSRIQANMAMDYEAQLQELFQYIEKRASAGAASNSDKERVRARSLNARSSRIEQEAAQAAAGVELARLVNLAPASLRLPDLEDVGISIVPAKLEQAMPLAIDLNPDIAVLQAELRAADIDKTAAQSRFLPRVDIEYSDNDSLHAGGQAGNQHDQRLMFVMNWSLFNGGGDIKLSDEKAARREEIKYKLDDQRRRVLQSLSAQYATLEATRERINSGYNELESISTAAKAMSMRMVSGNQSLLDMLDVYDRFYQARTRLVTLHVQEMGAVAQIARLLQGVPRLDDAAETQSAPETEAVK